MPSTCVVGGCCSASPPQQSCLDEESDLCSGRICDEECIKAAAAIACDVTCNDRVQFAKQDASGCSQSFRLGIAACADHLQAAFDSYSSLLEQARCICRRALADQQLKGHSSEVLAQGCSGSAFDQGLCSTMVRQRRNLPCFDKRAVLHETATSSSCNIYAGPSPIPCDPGHESTIFYLEPPRHATPTASAATGNSHCASGSKESSCCKKTSMPDLTMLSACGEATIEPAGHHTLELDRGIYTKTPSAKTASVQVEGRQLSFDLERGQNNEHVVFNVTGMECTGCEGIVRKALIKLPGVSNLHVVFVTATASCSIDPAVTTVDQVIRTMERTTKYKLSRFEDRVQYLDISTTKPVEAMDLTNGISSIKRIDKATVRLGYDATAIGARSVLASLPGAHLAPPFKDQASNAGIKHYRRMALYTILATTLTIPILVLAWGSTNVSERDKIIIDLVLATFVQTIAGPIFYAPAISALVTSHMIEMDMLVVISITAAYGYSLIAFAIVMAGIPLETRPIFETSSLLITLVLLGRLIAAYSRKKAVASVSLRSLQPVMARLVQPDEKIELVDARLLEFHDTVVVQPSSQIVTDGSIIAGSSEVDESMVTGESLPVLKSMGDAVVAGTMNGTGILHVKVTRLPGSNTITDIAKLVEEVHGQKPRVQDLADKVASYFIPVVVAIALIVTAIWIAVNIAIKRESTGAAIGSAITYGIAVLAISCPCALGLAVPMVLVVTGGKAARAGIIIKTADVIERGYKTTDVVFDKTGTLTEDRLSVLEEVYLEHLSHNRKSIIGLVRAMTRDNEHPVSKAMSTHLQNDTNAIAKLSEVKVIPGLGVTALSDGSTITAGGAEMAGVAEHPKVKELVTRGLTIFCVASDAKLLAVFGLKTTVRTEARAVVQNLQKRHIAVHIVSGDTQQAVDMLAEHLNIPPGQAHGKRSPGQKRDHVADLMEQGKVVLFCGDGTNDAVAVTQANVGVQIAPSASDVTRATADVVLMSNDLAGILQLLDISRASYLRICFNFLWAGLYNVFAVLLASGAFVRFRVEPAYAGLGEIVSIVPVVLTALTMRRPKRNVVA